MRADLSCRLCNYTSRPHSYQRPFWLYEHYKRKHPEELEAMQATYQAYKQAKLDGGWHELDSPLRL